MNYIVIAAAIALGIILILWGFKTYRVWLGLIGFTFGYAFGGMLGQFTDSESLQFWLMIGFGIILGLIAYTLFKFAFTVSGALIGAVAAGYVLRMVVAEPQLWVLIAVYVIGAIVGGIIARMFIKPYLILSTSLFGGALLTLGIYSIFIKESVESLMNALTSEVGTFPWYIYSAIAVLALFGIVYQFKIFKGHEPKGLEK